MQSEPLWLGSRTREFVMSLGYVNQMVATEHRAQLLSEASRWRRGREAKRAAGGASAHRREIAAEVVCRRAAAPVRRAVA